MCRSRANLKLILTVSGVLAFAVQSPAQTANVAGVSGPSNPAVAVNARDPAAAEALFRAGRDLLHESRLEEAYAKFQESYRLDPTAGALFNEGECRLKQGKTASAWALYQQAATLADVQGKPDLYDLANSRVSQLQGDLSYLTLHVPQPVPGLEVTRDGALVGPAQFDVSLPIDPGRHAIVLRAPGYETLELAVVIGEKHDRQTLNVPKLREQPLAAPAPVRPVVAMPVAAATVQSKPNPWPWVVGGAGATSLLVGSVSGILAIRENHRMADACPTRLHCSNDVLQAQGRRDLETRIAWVGIPVGLVAVGSAATWMVMSRSPKDAKLAGRATLVVDTTAPGRDFGLKLLGDF